MRSPAPFTQAPGKFYLVSKMGTEARPVDYNTVFTTGQAATICHVSPRTVTKWCETWARGKKTNDQKMIEKGLQHFRVPGSLDRRIPCSALRSFMEYHSIPVPQFMIPPPKMLAYGVERSRLPDGTVLCEDHIEFGAKCNETCPPEVVALGDGFGVSAMLQCVTFVRRLNHQARFIISIGDDVTLPQDFDLRWCDVINNTSQINHPPAIMKTGMVPPVPVESLCVIPEGELMSDRTATARGRPYPPQTDMGELADSAKHNVVTPRA